VTREAALSDACYPRYVISENCWQSLQRWFQTPLGAALLAEEQRQLTPLLSNLFGYHLLQVGELAAVDLLAASRVRNPMIMRSAVSWHPPIGRETATLIGSERALPIASDTLDLLLLPHTLDYTLTPHQLLREAERVLIPEGRLILIGFNPVSLWGGAKLLLGWRRHPAPWACRFLSAGTLRDWLALLGFEVIYHDSFFFRPPWQPARWLQPLTWCERLGEAWHRGGAVYLLVARKRVATLTPIRPRWRPRRALLADRLVKPTFTPRRQRGASDGRCG